MMTTTLRESNRQVGTEQQGRAPGRATAPPRAVNPVWAGLALGGVVQRKCTACAGGGSCPACDEEESMGGH